MPPASERAPWLPPQVDPVFARALAKGPTHRYPSSAALVEALREALRGTAPPPRPLAPRRRRSPLVALLLAGGFLLAAAGLAAALLATRGDDPATAPVAGRETVTRQVTVAGGPTTVVQTVTDAPLAPGPQAAIDPEEAAELNDEAFTLMQDGRWEEALPLLERAVPALRKTYSTDFPYEAYAEYNLGRTLEELDRCTQARRHLRRSERLQGEHEEITAALERCGSGKNDKDDD